MKEETKSAIKAWSIFIIIAGLIFFGLYKHKQSQHSLSSETKTSINEKAS